MTESKSDTPQPTKTATTTAKSPASQAGSSPAPRKGAGTPSRKKRNALILAFVIVVLVAVALAAALWYQHRQFKQTTVSLTSQMQASAAAASQASQQAQQALSSVGQQSSQLSALRVSLEKSQEQTRTLELAFQNLTDSGSNVALINDIDHIVTIANQQLTLNGNVSNAIVALESAQARLARANRPGLASLQQTINGDLDSLRAASVVDVAALTTQLNKLGELISQASLLVPDDAAPAIVPEKTNTPEPDESAPTAASGNQSTWRKVLNDVGVWSKNVWSSTSHELERLISIRRVNDPAALLMSPDQAHQLRENLRLRIMTAQLALMMHQSTVWGSETRALVQALHTRYDIKDPRTRKALALATDLARTPIDVKMPTLDNSVHALQTLREADSPEPQPAAPDAVGSNQSGTSQE